MAATPETPAPAPALASFDLDAAAGQAIAACGGDAREAVKALLVVNEFQEAEMAQLRPRVSKGYARGRLPAARTWEKNRDV